MPPVPARALVLFTLFCLALPALAAEEADAPKGATVTVLKATKACFPAIVEGSGIVRPREETFVRPERAGLKVIEILADPGDSVTAGETLARLSLPEGGSLVVQSPVAGLIGNSTARDWRACVSPRRSAVYNHRPQRVRPDRRGARPATSAS